ncbi:zinc finger protein [Macleaya cordata]|uniref:Zinc finger protein n=1 Tax=Macleaya cordata TaxID=56857 RepID=A0A200PXQ0_MACCD|nr:zinc finger protein [Macleaya cordata]
MGLVFAGFRKKKSGANKDGKDDCGKVYECRFCSLKFCKSQALGGHMNRHRQGKETETLNRARQLVFSNEPIAAQGCPHIGLRDPILSGARPIPSVNFHQAGSNMGDPSQPFRSVYPTRLFSGSSSTILSQQPPPSHQPYLYSSSSPSSRLVSFPSQYPPPHHHLMNDYHLINGGVAGESNYTCIGAPLGHVFPHEADRAGRVLSLSAASGRGGGEVSLQSQEDGLNWGPSSYTRRQQQQQQHLDPSSINRFQDGF